MPPLVIATLIIDAQAQMTIPERLRRYYSDISFTTAEATFFPQLASILNKSFIGRRSTIIYKGLTRAASVLQSSCKNRVLARSKIYGFLLRTEPKDVLTPIGMNTNSKTWLQLYVDAMTEKDPYKRLALVQQLRKMPKHDDSEEMPQEPVVRSVKKPKLARRRH